MRGTGSAHTPRPKCETGSARCMTMRGCAYWESPLQAVLQVNALCVQASQAQSVLDAAKSECSRVSSLADFERSPYMIHAACSGEDLELRHAALRGGAARQPSPARTHPSPLHRQQKTVACACSWSPAASVPERQLQASSGCPSWMTTSIIDLMWGPDVGNPIFL